MDFRQVRDNEWHQYAQLNQYLDGRGVASIEETMKEIVLQPVHFPFRELTNPGMLQRLLDQRRFADQLEIDADLLSEVEQKSIHLLTEISRITGVETHEGQIKQLAAQMRSNIASILMLQDLRDTAAKSKSRNLKSAVRMSLSGLGSGDTDRVNWCILFGWAVTHNLGRIMDGAGAAHRSQAWIDEWLLGRILVSAYIDLGLSEQEARDAVKTIKILVRHHEWYLAGPPRTTRSSRILQGLLADEIVQSFLQVNRYQEILWFNQESFDELLTWMIRSAAINSIDQWGLESEQASEQISTALQVIRKLRRAAEGSDYQVEKLLDGVN
jgi:hypothetical protein